MNLISYNQAAQTAEAIESEQCKMMAHDVSARALSSALPHRPSSYPNQDQLKSSRNIPILSVPEILEAFHQTHPANNSNHFGNSAFRSTSGDPWELPELKWLDTGDNGVLGPCENLADIDKYPDQSLASGLAQGDKLAGAIDGGERWPLPTAFYPGDRVAAANCASTLDDCFAQFSLPPMLNSSPAESGSSALTKNITVSTRRSSSSCLNTMSDFAGRDFHNAISQSMQQGSEWRRNASSSCSGAASQKRPAPSEKLDSDLSQEKSKSDRSNVSKAGVKFLPGTTSSSEVSALAAPIPRLEKKRKLQSSGGISASCDAGSSKAKGSTPAGPGGDQKITVGEKGIASGMKAVVNDRTVSSGRETGQKPAAAPIPAAVASTGGVSPGAAASDHDIHIWTERERRKKMNGMFSSLHALLPHLTTKADKATIVDEAIHYIQSLEGTMKGLLKQKCEASSDVLMPSGSLAILQASTHNSVSSSLATSTGGEADKIQSTEAMTWCENVKLDVKPSAAGQSSNSTAYAHAQQGILEPHEFQTLCTPNVVLNVCGSDVFVTICSPRGNTGLLCRVLFAMETHGLHVLNAYISTKDDTAMYMFHTQTADANEFSKPDTRNLALRDLTSCLPKRDDFSSMSQQPACTTSTRCSKMVQHTTSAAS